MFLWWNSYLCCRCVKHHWKFFFSFCFIAVHIHIFKIWANWGTTGWLKRLKRISVHWAGTVVRSLARAGLQQPGCWPSDTASAPRCANLGWNYSRGSQDVPWAGLNSGPVPSLPCPHPGWHSRISTARGGHLRDQNQTSSGEKNININVRACSSQAGEPPAQQCFSPTEGSSSESTAFLISVKKRKWGKWTWKKATFWFLTMLPVNF